MGLVGKGLVLAAVMLATQTGATDLTPAERAWRTLADGGDPVALADGSPRARWMTGDLVELRLQEDTDPELAASAYAALRDQGVAAGDSALVLLAVERLAHLDLEARRTEAAVPRLQRALLLAQQLDLPLATIHAQLKLGLNAIRQRDLVTAASHLQLVAAADIAPARWRGDAALYSSLLSRMAMDLDATLILRQDAYDLYTQADHLPGRARAKHYIGTTHAMRGELTRAMVALQHAEELARGLDDPDELSGCLGDQANIRFLTGEFDRARAQYREAISLTSDPRRLSYYFTNLASILTFQGRHDEAVPVYQDALDLVRSSPDRSTEPLILVGMGQSRCVLGDLVNGLADLDSAMVRARAVGLPLHEVKALEVKGHALLDEGRLDAAEPLLRTAVSRADTLGYFDLQESARAGLAAIAHRRGDLDEAGELLDEAIAIVERVRRRSGGAADLQSGYLAQGGRTFDALIDVLDDQHAVDPAAGHDRRAWEVAQRGRARMLLDLLAEAEVDLRVRADASYRQRERTILDGIAALDARRSAAPDSARQLDAAVLGLESRLTVLEAELRTADPRYADLRYPQPLDLTTLRRQVLAPGEAVLEFQLGAHRSHGWLITPDRFTMHRLAAAAEIEAAVADLLPLLRDPSLTAGAAAWYTGPARALARLILDPFLADLEDVDRLIVVADGVLHYLPLAALPVSDEPAGAFHEVTWLADRLQVVATPSVSTLSRLRAMPPVAADAPPLLLLSNPELPGPDAASVFVRVAGAAGMAPVPGADAEQQALIELYGRRARWWAGPRATAARLATDPGPAGAWRSVHLITHGLFNEERPRYSGLVLSADESGDGFLDVAEIFGLDLPCDQVVLSACSSALGEAVDGEGLVGFVQAFLYAGARNVVAALWDVDGDGGARFMRSYHQRLADRSAPPRAAALAAARRELARDTGVTSGGVPLAHPGIWAAFVSLGDGR